MANSMVHRGYPVQAERKSYDVIIVGGAIMGSSTAFFLSDNTDFNGSVLVVERDPGYENCSTARTNSCIRQQFSNELNIRISRFAAEFIKQFRQNLGGDELVPQLSIENFGYLYLANQPSSAENLKKRQEIQAACGTATRLLRAEEIKAAYPFYRTDDIILGSLNTVDEGYWDGGVVFEWLRRKSRERGIEYIANEVVGLDLDADGRRVQSVRLASGEAIACGHLVNASGPRAASVARMAGIELPVEPRKRYSWVFKAENPLDRPLPLTIDPSGVHVRQDGPGAYLAGGHATVDPAVPFDDFSMDSQLWESHVWPSLANRIPAFESIRVINEWAGHYAYNTFDQNAIVGPHEQVENFLFLNGFSGHGLQQSPAMGRGMSELLTYGEYRSLDLSAFSFGRILRDQPFTELAII